MYLKSVTNEQAICTLFHVGPTGNGFLPVRQNQSKYPGTQVWALSENCNPSGHFWIGSWTPSRHSENKFFVIPTFPFSHSATAASLRFPKIIQNKWNLVNDFWLTVGISCQISCTFSSTFELLIKRNEIGFPTPNPVFFIPL